MFGFMFRFKLAASSSGSGHIADVAEKQPNMNVNVNVTRFWFRFRIHGDDVEHEADVNWRATHPFYPHSIRSAPLPNHRHVRRPCNVDPGIA